MTYHDAVATVTRPFSLTVGKGSATPAAVVNYVKFSIEEICSFYAYTGSKGIMSGENPAMTAL